MCDPHLISREIINSNGSPDESLLFFAWLIFKEVIVGGKTMAYFAAKLRFLRVLEFEKPP